MLQLERAIKVKAKVLLILVLIFSHFSCFLYVYKPQSIEKRLYKHAKDISRSDTSEIDFTGIYLEAYNRPQNTNIQIYNYYKFFPNGKAYHSKGFYGKKPFKKDIQDFSSGKWSVYFIKGNNIYVEQFNGYNGYNLRRGYFSKDYKEILFTDEINSIGKLQDKVTDIYILELLDD